jgi:hypothetical protein
MITIQNKVLFELNQMVSSSPLISVHDLFNMKLKAMHEYLESEYSEIKEDVDIILSGDVYNLIVYTNCKEGKNHQKIAESVRGFLK